MSATSGGHLEHSMFIAIAGANVRDGRRSRRLCVRACLFVPLQVIPRARHGENSPFQRIDIAESCVARRKGRARQMTSAITTAGADAVEMAGTTAVKDCQQLDMTTCATQEQPEALNGRLLNKRGLEVTTRSRKCVELLDKFTDEVLAYGSRSGSLIRKALGEDPGCLYAHTCLAAASMFADKVTGFQTVELHLQEAESLAETGTERERLFLQAVQHWKDGNMDAAFACHHRIAEDYPRDVYSVKLCQTHYLLMGRKEGILRISLQVLAANAEDHFVLGMHCFALVECGKFEEAEVVGRRAVRMAPGGNDPWAHHSVAHVLEETGRGEEGIAWMREHERHWERCNSFMFTHNWWHTALFLIELKDLKGAMNIYEQKIWCQSKKRYRDPINATSLLWRLELRQVDVKDKWADLARYLRPRISLSLAPFNDLHHAYALARAGDTKSVNVILKHIFGLEAETGYYVNPKRVITPLVRFVAHFALGQMEEALTVMVPVLENLRQVGGSNAQQDVFVRSHIMALLHTGRTEEAKELLEKKFEKRQSSSFYDQHMRRIDSQELLCADCPRLDDDPSGSPSLVLFPVEEGSFEVPDVPCRLHEI